jgi:hypothetical protein
LVSGVIGTVKVKIAALAGQASTREGAGRRAGTPRRTAEVVVVATTSAGADSASGAR